MNPSFNLVDQPWLPCIDRNGCLVHLNLRDALCEAGDFQGIAGTSPLMTAALYRMLLTILHRVFGPSGPSSWYALWKKGRWDAGMVEQYLQTWRGRFDLFDPQRPFYQQADPRVKPKSVASIIHEAASGNNATLFDHTTDGAAPVLTPAQAARFLITAQSFSLAGLSGLPEKFTDSACSRGAIFVVEGDNLFETLALNLVRYSATTPIPSRPEDRPAWEMDDPFTPARSTPFGYLDYLTWQSRRVLLIPEGTSGSVTISQMTIAPGLKLDASVLDPMKHYRIDKDRGPLPLRFNEEKSLWRDSTAMFELQSADKHVPQVLHWLADLIADDLLPRSYQYRILSLGMANDQAKVEFFRTERIPLPLVYLDDPLLVDTLRDALKLAEAAGAQLWGATRKMAALLLSPEADSSEGRQPGGDDVNRMVQHWGMEKRYWSALENPFSRLIVALGMRGQSALDDWNNEIKRAAREAFRQAEQHAGQQTRSWKARVVARKQLERGLGNVFAVPS